jgi:hypothetical protein
MTETTSRSEPRRREAGGKEAGGFIPGDLPGAGLGTSRLAPAAERHSVARQESEEAAIETWRRHSDPSSKTPMHPTSTACRPRNYAPWRHDHWPEVRAILDATVLDRMIQQASRRCWCPYSIRLLGMQLRLSPRALGSPGDQARSAWRRRWVSPSPHADGASPWSDASVNSTGSR